MNMQRVWKKIALANLPPLGAEDVARQGGMREWMRHKTENIARIN